MTTFVRFYQLASPGTQNAFVDINPELIKSLSTASIDGQRVLVIVAGDSTDVRVLPVDVQGNVLDRAHEAKAETILENAREYIRREEQR